MRLPWPPWPPPRDPRPPTTVVVTATAVLLAAVATVAWAIGALALDLRPGLRPPTTSAYDVALAFAFAGASWRRQAVAWWAVMFVGAVSLAFGLVLGGAGLAAGPSPGMAALFLTIFLAPVLVAAAYLRRSVRAWHGFACPACGAFRWRMASPATRAACRRCGEAYGEDP